MNVTYMKITNILTHTRLCTTVMYSSSLHTSKHYILAISLTK